ncbi:MAG: glycoside hydrolase family 19 protein [Methylococcales bacterium]
MSFELTQEHVDALIPRAIGGTGPWLEALNEALPQYEINTIERVAAFIAQCAHESGGFSVLEENLNYKAATLSKLWPQRFPPGIAEEYAGNPEKIANKTYGSRMGNGDEHTGEGYKYRGRGLLQLTGKDNYRACSQALFQDTTLLEDPDLLLDPYYAIHSACWFWSKNKLNQYADSGDFTTMTKKINGGTIGLDDRIHHYNAAVDVLEK